jgi:hypothetical protein
VNIKIIRHRVASYFLLLVCRLTSIRLLRRAASSVARVVCGPLDPERLYIRRMVRVMSLPRAAPTVPSARPDTATLPDAHPEDSDLEKWLAEEARCEP